MIVSAPEKERLRALDLPGSRETRDAVRDYIDRAGLSMPEFADRINYGHSTLKHFLCGTYSRVSGSDLHLREAAWNFISRFPLGPSVRSHGRLFETKNVRIMRSYFEAAVERGEVCLIYGPPGTQKTFTLEHLIAERNRSKKNDALYVYASYDMTPLALIKAVGREAGIRIASGAKDRVMNNLLDWCRRQQRGAAVIVDEAQHLTVGGLETLRQLHDLSGCGMVLAGSHDLYEKFLRSRAQLEQWLSRIDHKEPLPGLLEDEVREISVRELGNGQPARLTEKTIQTFIDQSRVDDIFAHGADGKREPQKYLSVRRLVKVLDQVKASKETTAMKGLA